MNKIDLSKIVDFLNEIKNLRELELSLKESMSKENLKISLREKMRGIYDEYKGCISNGTPEGSYFLSLMREYVFMEMIKNNELN